jgi:AcrR family transcriptional regulator
MPQQVPVRRVRADARDSEARILEAASTLLSADPRASLEDIAEHAGLTRATVHRRFASRRALTDALVDELTARYVRAFHEARVATSPPLVALHRLTERAFELKLAHPFAVALTPGANADGLPASHPVLRDGLEMLFRRMHGAGLIAVSDAAWCRRLYLALLHEVHELPADAPVLTSRLRDDDTGARVDLLISTLIPALGGEAT